MVYICQTCPTCQQTCEISCWILPLVSTLASWSLECAWGTTTMFSSKFFLIKNLPISTYFVLSCWTGLWAISQAIEEGLKLEIETNQLSVEKGCYERLVWRLIYLAHIRHDIAYVSSMVSQFLHNHGEKHMLVVMRIKIYLKELLETDFCLRKNDNYLKVECALMLIG